jgi:hypothetical protein
VVSITVVENVYCAVRADYLIQRRLRLVFKRLNSGLEGGNGQPHAPDDLPQRKPPPVPKIGRWVDHTARLDFKRKCLTRVRNRFRNIQLWPSHYTDYTIPGPEETVQTNAVLFVY